MESIDQLLQQGNMLYQKKSFDEAEKYYKTILNQHPEHIKALIGLSLSLFYNENCVDIDQFEQALSWYRKAIILSAADIQIIIDFAELINGTGTPQYLEEALTIFDEVLAKEPSNYRAISGKAYGLYRLSRFEECVNTCSLALAINKTDSDIWFYLAWSHMRLNNSKDAFECFDMSVKINPVDDVAWCYRALMLNELKRYEEAIESADKALKINPSYSTAMLYKKDALKGLGKNDEAKEIEIPYEPIDNM